MSSPEKEKHLQAIKRLSRFMAKDEAKKGDNMNLEKIYKDFSIDFDIASSNEANSLYELSKEIKSNFKPIFESLYPDYNFEIDIKAENADFEIDSVFKNYYVELFIWTGDKTQGESFFDDMTEYVERILTVRSFDYFRVSINLILTQKGAHRQTIQSKADEVEQKLTKPFIKILKGKVLPE